MERGIRACLGEIREYKLRSNGNMKKMIAVFSLLSSGGLLACSQITTISRGQLTANLAPILKIEERADAVKANTQILGLVGQITTKKVEELKTHFDVYYVHYLAASVYLARGSMEDYKAHLRQAETELEAMEAILQKAPAISNAPTIPKEQEAKKTEALFPSSLM